MRNSTSILAGTFWAAFGLMGATASRSCPEPLLPIAWVISEWTYDAPDPTAPGRAATDAAVGLYLTTGRTDFSCFGSWPDGWDGWAERGETLIWYACDVNRGRKDDETVSFAMDWKTRTIHTAHAYTCSDGPRRG